MKIKVFTNNPWQENTIVLYDETGEAVVIDCGCFSKEEGQRLKSFLVENQLTPVALLNTHLHIDHIFGNKLASHARVMLPMFMMSPDWHTPPCNS